MCNDLIGLMHYLCNEKLIEKKILRNPLSPHSKRMPLKDSFFVSAQRFPQIHVMKHPYLWENFFPRPESCLRTPPWWSGLTIEGAFMNVCWKGTPEGQSQWSPQSVSSGLNRLLL